MSAICQKVVSELLFNVEEFTNLLLRIMHRSLHCGLQERKLQNQIERQVGFRWTACNNYVNNTDET